MQRSGLFATIRGSVKSQRCSNNFLTSLFLMDNTALTKLDCSRNQLTSLDVGFNPALTWLDCGGNQLTSLDVSHNNLLTMLICASNQLSSLDVSQVDALAMAVQDGYRDDYTYDAGAGIICWIFEGGGLDGTLVVDKGVVLTPADPNP